MKNRGLLLVVSGPAGAGKGTICKAFMERNPRTYLSISATTRKPRPIETEGVNYYFITKEQFQDMIDHDGLLEYACFCGNYYGTPKAAVEEKLSQGIDVILEIEVQGAMKVKEKYPQGVFLFVLPPSMQELRNRIIGRGTETMEIIEERLKTAAWEFDHISNYDYILLNNDIDEAVKDFENIIAAEKVKVSRNLDLIKEVCEK